MPPMMLGTTAPSFSAIMSLCTVGAFSKTPEAALGPLNAKLRALNVTAADKIARCARYDTGMQRFSLPKAKIRVLLFGKMTGFRDGPSVAAAEAMIRAMAARQGWALAETLKGGAINAVTLQQFDVLVWNNVSGDVLTLTQRRALQDWMERGGGFVAMHGSGGDPVYFWDWYVDKLIGARFIGHPMAPQFQAARVQLEPGLSGIGAGLGAGWTMTDEWYSFKTSARAGGAHVIATLDEASYSPVDMFKHDLRMGDHPIAWTRCVGNGRSFYSASGHRPEVYADPQNMQIIEHAIVWAAGHGASACAANREVAHAPH
jgi:type 1 glutamine amidotransferase